MDYFTSKPSYIQRSPLVPVKDRILHKRTQVEYPSALEGVVAEAQISLKAAQELIELGSIYCNGQRTELGHKWPVGSQLRLHLFPRRFHMPTENPQKLILFKNQDFLVAVKPAGLPTHATLDNKEENLLAFLKEFGPLYPAHRLDQMTTGLILIARTPEFVKKFQLWQKNGQIKKIYEADVDNPVSIGRLVHYSPRSFSLPRPMFDCCHENSQRCELEILSCVSQGSHYQLQIQLKTGRTHQIRAQLASLGHPLLGDHLYGSQKTAQKTSSLRCVALSLPPQHFDHSARFELPSHFVSD